MSVSACMLTSRLIHVSCCLTLVFEIIFIVYYYICDNRNSKATFYVLLTDDTQGKLHLESKGVNVCVCMLTSRLVHDLCCLTRVFEIIFIVYYYICDNRNSKALFLYPVDQ